MHLTILHVEDNQLVAATVKELLADEGWRVTLCPDGPAGLRALESHTPYDLLLMDNELPGLDGWRLIQHAHPAAPTSHADHHDVGQRHDPDSYRGGRRRISHKTGRGRAARTDDLAVSQSGGAIGGARSLRWHVFG
ncbi:MAG: response regulator [Pyrinomonadaceae bacterium]